MQSGKVQQVKAALSKALGDNEKVEYLKMIFQLLEEKHVRISPQPETIYFNGITYSINELVPGLPDKARSQQLSQPSKSINPTQPAKTTDSLNLSQLSELTDLSEPTQPVEPSEPTQPIEPFEPTQPIEPSEPTQLSQNFIDILNKPQETRTVSNKKHKPSSSRKLRSQRIDKAISYLHDVFKQSREEVEISLRNLDIIKYSAKAVNLVDLENLQENVKVLIDNLDAMEKTKDFVSIHHKIQLYTLGKLYNAYFEQIRNHNKKCSDKTLREEVNKEMLENIEHEKYQSATKYLRAARRFADIYEIMGNYLLICKRTFAISDLAKISEEEFEELLEELKKQREQNPEHFLLTRDLEFNEMHIKFPECSINMDGSVVLKGIAGKTNRKPVLKE